MPAIALNPSTDSSLSLQSSVRKRRVLVVSDHPTESREVAKNLRSLGFDVQLSLFDGNTVSAIPKRAPDAVLCHLTDYAEFGPRLAKVLRSHFSSRSIPLIGAMSRPISKERSSFDTTLFAPVHASQIANRVNAMIRLGVMEGEITRRLTTLHETYGQAPEIGNLSPDRKLRVLFIGKASPSFMIIINALQDNGVDIVAAFTSFSAFDYLHGEPFDAVIMNALEQNEPTFSISEAMRRNSKLYHTPTLFLVDGDTFNDHEKAFDRGARDIIDINSNVEEISGRILELANYHRVHEQMKVDFQRLSIELTGDKTQSAYSEKFLRAHLPHIISDAQTADHPVSLLSIKLLPESVEDVTEFVSNAAMQQAVDLLGNLIRMQDVMCRWETDIVVLVFYDTTEFEARSVLARIRDLLDCTIFKNGASKDNALTVSAQSSGIELDPAADFQDNVLDKLIANLIHDPD